jgi:RecA-family ATPase
VIHDTEKTAAEHVLSLPREDRPAALARIERLIAANTPAAEVAEAVAEMDAAEELEFVTARHAIENPRAPVIGLWGEVLIPGEASGVIARGGVGKTTITRNLMIRSAEGTGEFLGRPFSAGPVRWLYCTREGSGGWWLDRLRRTAGALGADDALDRIALMNWADDCGLYLTTPKDVERIRRVLDKMQEGDGVDAVTFDPFTDFKAGSDQDDEAVQAAFAAIKALCSEFGVAAWVPHHASQNGEGMDAARGSTKYEGTVAAQLNLTAGVKDSRGKALPDTVRKVKLEKNRYGRKTTHYLDFDEATEVYSDRAKPGVTSECAIALRAAGEPGATITEMVKATGASDSAVRDAVKGLEAEAKAERAGEGRPQRHRLTEKGYSNVGLSIV